MSQETPASDAFAERSPPAVNNTDWLKAAAIIFVSVDHFGYFFIDDAAWWSVFGRLAAPCFFFLMGYANTRTVPLSWIWLGVILTLLESWNADWSLVTPNILFSFALIHLARPYVLLLFQRVPWVGFVLLVAALVAILPIAAQLVDYGAEGWLWALLGICQRIYVDENSALDVGDTTGSEGSPVVTISANMQVMRVLACLVAAAVYIWQEQLEFSFSELQFTVFVLEICALSAVFMLFRRAPSRLQPQALPANGLRFIGRTTLEIYAIQLAGFEIIIKLFPDLAP